MARGSDPYRLSLPHVYLWRMLLFVILIGFVGIILYRPVIAAFRNNPGLNGLIVAVALIGIVLTFRSMLRLFREVTWVNRFRTGQPSVRRRGPVLLAPMAQLMRDGAEDTVMSAVTMRSVLDTIATRLDESREISRYLTGLLVFLGLLGTFWGLLQTIGSVGATIQSLDFGTSDAVVLFEDLKEGLQAPLSGMGTAFSSSLFGLTGSLVLGFLDLQAGQGQNRFYNELENWLATMTDLEVEEVDTTAATEATTRLVTAIEELRHSVEESTQVSQSRAAIKALSTLAEGIQGLVKHLRAEQKLVREWADSQSQQNERIEALLVRLNDALEQDERSS